MPSRSDEDAKDPTIDEGGWASHDPEMEALLAKAFAYADPGTRLGRDGERMDPEAIDAVTKSLSGQPGGPSDVEPVAAEVFHPTGQATSGRRVRWGVIGGLAAAAAVAGITLAVSIGSTGGSGDAPSASPDTQSAETTSSAPEIVDVDSPNNSDGRPTLTTVTLDDGTVIDVYADAYHGYPHVGNLIETTSAVVNGTETSCSVYVGLDDSGDPIDGEYVVSLDGGATYLEASRRD